MPLRELIQKLILMSEAGAARVICGFVLGLAVVGLALVYDLRAYWNLATQAMSNIFYV